VGDKPNKEYDVLTNELNEGLLSAEHGYCVYKDHQIITIQEEIEKVPLGLLPSTV
jgi:DNA replicative helicase MCM subunit Mcm2 (Cdc46/Mcm family)